MRKICGGLATKLLVHTGPERNILCVDSTLFAMSMAKMVLKYNSRSASFDWLRPLPYNIEFYIIVLTSSRLGIVSLCDELSDNNAPIASELY